LECTGRRRKWRGDEKQEENETEEEMEEENKKEEDERKITRILPYNLHLPFLV